jgi:hypothetical protein
MSDLARLHRMHRAFGGAAATEKRALIARIDRSRLRSAAQVLRFHEILLYLRTYPDDAMLLAETERALGRFSRRADLRRCRAALADTGIGGTAIHYRFFWAMARWLAMRWPDRLRYDPGRWDDFEPRLRAALPLLSTWIEGEAIRRSEADTRAILDRLRGLTTGASYVVRRIGRLGGGSRVQESVHDGIDAAYVLHPGAGGPSRTEARWEDSAIVFPDRPPERARPDLLEEIGRPPADVWRVGPRDGARLIDLARASMVTRARDLDAFTWGSPTDVRLVEDGDGLAFAMIGMQPDRRLPLPVVHGWLTLRNGVPIGYVQSDTLLSSCEVSFNTFDTFRGVEAGHVFARVLAAARHVLGARSFSIEPYQLGHGNHEGLESGAWWFYVKLGFRPKDRAVARLYARERSRMRRDRSYRSDEPTLARLARRHVYWEPDPRHPALLPLVPTLGLRLPPSGAADASAILQLGSLRGWSAGERLALERLAPVVAALPGVTRWSAAEKRALGAALRGKGGPDELIFLKRLDAHPKAKRALARLLTAQRRAASLVL